jgi:hypothetical protein
MGREHSIKVTFSDEELARLDEIHCVAVPWFAAPIAQLDRATPS